MDKKRSVVKVQGTNDYSTVSKYSMVQLGYFSDDYIQYFVRKAARRSPLINLGYYVRQVNIDYVLKSFLFYMRNKPAQVISLGCGFDTSFFRLKQANSLYPSAVYCEIDFPKVVTQKAESIRGCGVLSNAAGIIPVIGNSLIPIITRNYRLVGSDLEVLDNVEDALTEVKIDFSIPTLFVAEVSLVYLREHQSTKLIHWITRKFSNVAFVAFEQVYPKDGFGCFMMKHFDEQNTPLFSVRMYPSLESVEQRFRTKGWKTVEVLTAYDTYMNISSNAEHIRALSLEPFDEVEEWHLLLTHYASTVACKGKLVEWHPRFRYAVLHSSPLPKELPKVRFTMAHIKGAKFHRYGHRSIIIPPKNGSEIVVTGGYGFSETETRHSRISEVYILKYMSGAYLEFEGRYEKKIIKDGESVELATMDHTLTLVSRTRRETKFVLYGGRTSPMDVVNHWPVLITYEEGKEIICDTWKGNIYPPPRYRHSASYFSIYKSDVEGAVVIYGGKGVELESLGDIWIFAVHNDWSQSSFQEVKRDSSLHWPVSRFSHSASVWMNSKLFITGGIPAMNKLPLSDIWVFDCISLHWSEIVPDGPAMIPRYSHSSEIYNDILILIGGVNTLPGSQPGVCIFDIALRTCREYSLPNMSPENPIMIQKHSSEILEGTTVIAVLGGGGNCFSFGSSFNEYLLLVDVRQFLIQNQ